MLSICQKICAKTLREAAVAGLIYGLIFGAGKGKLVFAQPLDPSLPGYENVRPPERPIVKIISPESGSIVLGPKVSLEYLLSGVKLVSPDERKINIRGEGHLKIIFARKNYPVPTPKLFTGKSPIEFENIPEGDYRITVEVVKNTGKSYNPPVEDTTLFKVKIPISPIPSITPTPIPSPPTLYQRAFYLRKELILFLGTGLFVAPLIYLLASKMKL